MSQVVLVAGVARSGTAAVAATLARLGWGEPVDPGDGATGLVDLHRRLLDRSPVVRGLDARPEAAALVAGKLTDADRDRLLAWLAAQPALVGGGRLVVEDPRSLWFVELWREAAAAAGARLDVVTVLRHPAAVALARGHDPVEPRDDAEAARRRHRSVADVAGWVSATLALEAATRGRSAAVVRHDDLLSDPAATTERLLDALGGGREGTAPDPVAVPRVSAEAIGQPDGQPDGQPRWERLGVPEPLRALAETLWEQLAGPGPSDEAVLARLGAEHARLHDEAVAIALDHTFAAEVAARRTVRANLRSDYDAQVAELEQQLEEAHGGRDDDEPGGAGGSAGYDGYADARAGGTGGWFRRR